MKESAAYALATLGGNASPSADDISKIIAACGGEADADAAASICADLAGKTGMEVIAAGMEKVGPIPQGGGGGGGSVREDSWYIYLPRYTDNFV